MPAWFSMHHVLPEARRWHWLPWDWNYSWLWATRESNLCPLQSVATVLLNHWVISSSNYFIFYIFKSYVLIIYAFLFLQFSEFLHYARYWYIRIFSRMYLMCFEHHPYTLTVSPFNFTHPLVPFIIKTVLLLLPCHLLYFKEDLFYWSCSLLIIQNKI